MVPRKETVMADPMGKQMVERWVLLRAMPKADYLERHLAKPMACYWETQREWKMVSLKD